MRADNSNRIHPLFKLTALTISLLPLLGHADTPSDDSDPEVTLETMVVTVDTNQQSNTATGLKLSQKDTPQSVATVSKQELQERNISDLTEAVKTTTGVNVVKDQSRVRFQSRGFYMDQLSEDGMSQNLGGRSGYSDKIDVSTMTDLAIYDRIEVVRGATGLTQANSEPGGTINLVRKRPTADFRHAGELSVNSWGSVRGMLDVSGGLNTSDSVRGRAIVVHEDNQSFKDRVEGKKTLGSGSVEFDIGDNATAMIGATYQHTKDMPDFGGVILPCVQTNRWASKCENDGLQDFDRKTYLGMNWNKHDVKKKNYFADFKYYLPNGWTLKSAINHTDQKSDTRIGSIFADTETWPGVSASGYYSTFTLNPFRYDKTDKQTAFKLDLTGDYTLFDKTHDFYVGYTYNKEDIRSRYIKVWNDVIYWKDSNPGRGWNQTAGKYNPFNLTGDEVPEPNWDLYDDWGDHVDVYPEYDNFEKFRRYNYNTYVNTAKHHGATFSTRLNPTDKLHLLLGVRYNRFNMGSVKWMHVLNGYGEMYRSNIYGDAKQVGEMSGKKWVPFAGINYDLTPDHTAYVSYAEIFKPQEDTDVSYTAMLPPTIGTNYEIGLKGAVRDGRLNYALALFHTEHKNRAITRPDYGRWLTYADPVGKVVSRGVDVELSGDVTDNLRLSANYTYNKSDYKDVNAGVFEHLSRYNFNNHTPKHIFRLHSQYQLPNSKWQIGGGVSAQSETSSLRNIQQGGYALWHANVRYDMSDNVSVSLVGNNLTDKVYFENNPNRTRGKNNFYGEPRNFALKVDWKF